MIGDSTVADFRYGPISLKARVRPAGRTVLVSSFRPIRPSRAASCQRGVRRRLQTWNTTPLRRPPTSLCAE